MDIIKTTELLTHIRSFGFDPSLREFNDFVDSQDPERRAWLESASTFDALDWIAEALREQGFDS